MFTDVECSTRQVVLEFLQPVKGDSKLDKEVTSNLLQLLQVVTNLAETLPRWLQMPQVILNC